MEYDQHNTVINFVPINYDRAIQEQQNQNIKSLNKDLTQLSEMFMQFNKIINEQQQSIDNISNNSAQIEIEIHSTNENITDYSTYQETYYPYLIVAGSTIVTIIVVMSRSLICGVFY